MLYPRLPGEPPYSSGGVGGDVAHDRRRDHHCQKEAHSSSPRPLLILTALSCHALSSPLTFPWQHLLTGSDDGDVHVFGAEDGQLKTRLKGHTGPVRHVVANPVYEVVASACSSTLLWIPN